MLDVHPPVSAAGRMRTDTLTNLPLFHHSTPSHKMMLFAPPAGRKLSRLGLMCARQVAGSPEPAGIRPARIDAAKGSWEHELLGHIREAARHIQ